MQDPIELWRVLLAASSVVLTVFLGWLRPDWKAFRIVAISLGGTVGYAVIQDQITTRICFEYFTVAHPVLLGLPQHPTVLGLAWGVLGSLFGAIFGGISLAFCCHLGKRPLLPAKKAAIIVLAVLIVMGLTTVISGTIGSQLASSGKIPVDETLGYDIPPDKHVAFWTVAYAHFGTYSAGISGGVLACFVAIFWRTRLPATDEIKD